MKIIKKGKGSKIPGKTGFFNQEKPKAKTTQKTVERKIFNWVLELREKKNIESLQAHNLLTNLKQQS